MQGNFEDALKHVLVHEGGYVDHPKDPGGATNKGVTLAVFQRFFGAGRTKDDLKNISDELRAVYKMGYFDFTPDGEGADRPGLCVAFSPDGIHWAKHPRAPLVPNLTPLRFMRSPIWIDSSGRVMECSFWGVCPGRFYQLMATLLMDRWRYPAMIRGDGGEKR